MKYLALILLLTACMSRTEKNSEPAGLIKLKSGQKNCLTKHTNEAILINEKRAKVYSELSGGKSKIISFSLISLEKLSLPIAAKYDNEAHYFHQRNIHVLCDDLVSSKISPTRWS